MSEVSDSTGERLKRLRKSRGWSIGDASEEAGVRRSTWQTWEEGADPGASSAVRAARALGTTVEAIWGDRSLPPEDPADDSADIPTNGSPATEVSKESSPRSGDGHNLSSGAS